MSMDVQVILPVLNEARALPWVLNRMPKGFASLVVDNGSTDGSGDVARELGSEVILEPTPGFGAACWAGLLASTSDHIAFMDCDASFDPQELPLLVEHLLVRDLDMVLGYRRAEPGAWPITARLGNRVITWELRRRCGLQLRDLGPMRVMNRQALLSLGMRDRRFGWPLEMVLLASAAGWQIEEVPVTYRPRIGKSKVTGTIRGTARAVHDMAGLLR